MAQGTASPSHPENSRGQSLKALTTGLFAAWHRLLNRLATAVTKTGAAAAEKVWRTLGSTARAVRTVSAELTHSTSTAAVETVETLASVPGGIFAAWHRIASAAVRASVRIGRATVSTLRSWVRQWPRTLAYHVEPAIAFRSKDADTIQAAAALGARAFAFGILVAAAVASAPTGLAGPGLMTVISELLWAAARFVIIALLIPRGAIDRPRLSAAFLAGLIPYLLGANPLLRVVSLVLSALLTRRGLLGAGVPARATDLAIGWSFGGQIGVIAAGWIARAALTLIVGV